MRIFIALALSAAAAWGQAPATDPETEKAVKEYMAAAGIERQMEELRGGMGRMFREGMAKMLPGLTNDTLEVLGREFADEFMKLDWRTFVGAIYAKSFTLEELRELTKFLQTPLGRKLTEMGPKIAAESSAWGMKEGERIGRMVGERHSAKIVQEMTTWQEKQKKQPPQ